MRKRVLQRRALAATALVAAGATLWHGGRPELLSAYSFGSAVSDRDGRLLRMTLAADQQYRTFVPLDHVAPVMREATLLYEDRWFYWHVGVNPVALVKAFVHTYVTRDLRRGGSTLTMQLARLRYGIDSSTVPGKVLQIARALQLELYYAKRDVLEAYLNVAPYGGNLQGVGAASRIYFDKTPAELSAAEALALAVMPQNPGARAPAPAGKEPQALLEARRRLAAVYLARHAEADPGALALTAPLLMRQRSDLPFRAPHWVERLLPAAGPGELYTTLDLDLQTDIERRTRAYVERRAGDGIHNAAVMLVDTRSMEVLTSLGSADYGDRAIQGQVNGTVAKRSPGSALKPFIYGLAIEQGLIHPRSLLKDTPMRFGAYNPENFDGEFAGPITAGEALARSRNVPAVYLQTRLHGHGLYDLLQAAGISKLRPPEFYGLAIVLGGIEITMEEMVSLYAMLANDGEMRALRTVRDAPPGPRRRLLSPEAARLTLEMLREDARPHQTYRLEWVRDEVPVAWKTGTSYGYRDAWSVGVVGPYVLAVWVGNFDSRGSPAFVGRRAAGVLFFEIVDGLRSTLMHMRTPPPRPLRLADVEVCATSGALPSAHCPRTVRTSFIPGVSPIAQCDVHRSVMIESATGLRACDATRSNRSEVYEFWPSDLLALFDQAGMPRRLPPPYAKGCDIERRANAGEPPRITSPQPGIVYSLRADAPTRESLAFSASADADVRELRWFVDEQYVGHVKRGETLFWSALPGDFVVRVVDEHGRADAQELSVARVQ